jgi:hypothetical protein
MGVGAGVGAAYGAGETVMGGQLGAPRQDWGRQAAGQAMMPPGQMGLYRIPIVLRIGRTEHRAWLNLRDCQVEKDPNLPNVPVIAVDGLDVYPMPGQDPPEIQIRNARIRY